jgi:hypothetical protein
MRVNDLQSGHCSDNVSLRQGDRGQVAGTNTLVEQHTSVYTRGEHTVPYTHGLLPLLQGREKMVDSIVRNADLTVKVRPDHAAVKLQSFSRELMSASPIRQPTCDGGHCTMQLGSTNQSSTSVLQPHAKLEQARATFSKHLK